MHNLFDVTIPPLDSENFHTLLKNERVEIKTIVSNTLKTAQTFLQNEDEWVVVLQGCAKLAMDGLVYKLKKGDSLFIPAHKEHTLLKTKKIVIWLAIHMKN